MPSLGDTRVDAQFQVSESSTWHEPRRAEDWLQDARDRERAGAVPDAIACYESAISTAEETGEIAVLAESLRRLAVVRHHRDEAGAARALCERSYEIARAGGHEVLAAEALNSFGGLALTTGSLNEARRFFLEALELGASSRKLCARVEQNLGILANIQGNLDEAVGRYERSLEAYQSAGDLHGCALAYNNLGMACTDRKLFDVADRYFRDSFTLARRTGDVRLQVIALVNQAEVDVERQHFQGAKERAEEALVLCDRLEWSGARAHAYRVLGMMYRETSRPALAESLLREAITLAAGAGSLLDEAEGSRELALLYQMTERNREALQWLNRAYRLFRRLDARVDLIDVGGKVAELQSTYLAIVRAWGQSIESSDSYTFGHCERVAQNAVAMARALGLGEEEETTILLGAYLHDVGKVCVPHEILNKPGPLTPEERMMVQAHTAWGVALLADVEFPWDIKPIIRWHHERYDGSGYPNGLAGDDIPLGAQIVGILDMYDALTTTRPYREGLSPRDAVAEITRCRSWWSEQVLQAFLRVVEKQDT